MRKILALFLILQSCTYSINMVHTQGKASGVIEEEQGATSDIKPNLNIPKL